MAKTKQKLTPIQKVLIANGGVGHSTLRRGAKFTSAPKRRLSRADKAKQR